MGLVSGEGLVRLKFDKLYLIVNLPCKKKKKKKMCCMCGAGFRLGADSLDG